MVQRLFGRNQMTNLLNRLKEHKNKKAKSDSSLSSEYERYVHSDFITHLQYNEFACFDVLGFWKAKESMFPVLSRVPMNEASVQADEERALDAASQGTMASGSGGEEQDFDFDLTNYDIDD
ncbi:hypothetical protein Tco_1273078 [Tanacetum coccineum]